MEGKIFISYRREDSSWSTGRIYDRLARHFSEEQLFIDVDSIAPGEDFENYIENSVNNCDVLLAVIGQRWLEIIQSKSQELDFVRLEISAALKNNIRVIPILVENTKMPLVKDLPDELKSLARRNAFFINHVSFNSEIETLAQSLKKYFLQEAKLKEEHRQKKVEEEKQRLADEQLKLIELEEKRQKRLEDELRFKEAEENDLWKKTVNKNTKSAYNAYLQKYPKGKYLKRANSKLIQIKSSESTICKACNGFGQKKTEQICQQCKGKGKVLCPDCNGTGKKSVFQWRKLSAGDATCTSCNGVGTITCPSCIGSGKQIKTSICNSCRGTGWKGKI